MHNDLDKEPDRELWDLVLVEHDGPRVVLDLVGDAADGVERFLTISFDVEDDRDREELVETTRRWKDDSEPIELEAVRFGELTVVTMSAGGDGLTLTSVE